MLLHQIDYDEDADQVLEENRFLILKQRSLRSYIIDFVKTLTSKVMPSPTLANFLFSDSRYG
jgi:hypothetical protein